MDEAERELVAAVKYAPNTPEFVLGLTLLYQKQQRYAEALTQARRLVELRPNDLTYEQLLNEIQAQAASRP